MFSQIQPLNRLDPSNRSKTSFREGIHIYIYIYIYIYTYIYIYIYIYILYVFLLSIKLSGLVPKTVGQRWSPKAGDAVVSANVGLANAARGLGDLFCAEVGTDARWYWGKHCKYVEIWWNIWKHAWKQSWTVLIMSHELCHDEQRSTASKSLLSLTALGLKIFARGDQCSRAERHGGLSRQAPNQASWIQSHPRSTSFFSQVWLKDVFFWVLSLNCPGKPAVAETKAPPKQRDSSTIKKDIKVGCILLHGLPDRTVLVFVASGWWYRLCTVHHWEYRKDSRPLPDGLTLMTSHEIIFLDL